MQQRARWIRQQVSQLGGEAYLEKLWPYQACLCTLMALNNLGRIKTLCHSDWA
jgi:hypothetical protein